MENIAIGYVVKTTPYLRCYEVQVFGRTSQAYLMGGNSFDIGQGASELNTLLPGTNVLCYRPDTSVIFIIGVVPQQILDYVYDTDRFLTRQTGSGVTEELHSIDADVDTGTIQDRSAGMPGDALPGDWGATNPTGGAVFLSQFSAMLKAGDTTGVFAYFFDKLLRIYGYNLEEFTAITERTRFNDEGEAFDVEYGTKYPWEALGVGKPVDAFTDNETEWKLWKTGEDTKNYENKIAPKKQDQTGLWRTHKFKGYLGDLEDNYVALPSKDYNSEPIGRGDNKDNVNYSGLMHEHIGADGSYSLRSAKEIVFIKYPIIPVPQQTALPDDNTKGDWYKDYKPSGVFGEGDEPKPQEDWDWGEHAQNLSILDYLAYKFNWYNVANVTEHKNDWYLPEEEDVANNPLLPSRGTINPEKLTSLKENFWADIPDSVEVNIDHRAKDIKYYEGLSCIGMLDDGSVVLEDAWGSQIIMSQGNITLSPAGDLLMRPGRSVVAWSGKDVIMRAKENVDITSSDQDVRIKAEGNMHILGGNKGNYGGILLESRSDTPVLDFDNKVGSDVRSSGVVVKCKDSGFTVWAPDITLSARKVGNRDASAIYLDSNDGEAPIITKSSTFLEYLDEEHIMDFKDSSALNYFGRSACVVTSPNFIVQGGGVFTDGGLIVDGTIAGKNVVYDGEGPTLLAGADGVVADSIEDVSDLLDLRITAVEDALQQAEDTYRTNTGVLSNTTVQRVGFSLRTDAQYGISGKFSISATRWQQYLGESSDGQYWEESEVMPPGSSAPTLPHPGTKWNENVFYKGDNLRNFDIEKGLSKNRDDYESSADTQSKGAPKDSYIIL